jgi:hypothetical protein
MRQYDSNGAAVTALALVTAYWIYGLLGSVNAAHAFFEKMPGSTPADEL